MKTHNTSSRNRPAGLLLTPKAFNNKAQGRREGGAPWVRNERIASNPTGVEHASSDMNPRHAGHCPREMAIHVVEPRGGALALFGVGPRGTYPHF